MGGDRWRRTNRLPLDPRQDGRGEEREEGEEREKGEEMEEGEVGGGRKELGGAGADG